MKRRKRVNDMLTARDVARLLSIHINTVRRWTNLGILRTYRDGPRGDRRYRQEDIASFLFGQSAKVKRANKEQPLCWKSECRDQKGHFCHAAAEMAFFK